MPLMTDFFSIMRQLSVDNLRDAALEPPAIMVVGEERARDQVTQRLFGPEAQPYIRGVTEVPVRTKDETPVDLIVLVWDGQNETMLKQAGPAARAQGVPTVVVRMVDAPFPESMLAPGPITRVPVDDTRGDEWRRTIRTVLAEMDEERLLAVGRHFPVLRSTVADGLVRGTSVANAQFATMSNLPAVVPIIGNIIGATADFLVLTKNQMLLIFKLAAVYGRDIDDRKRVYVEMAPVVGAGFVWRTVARQLAALAPGLIGALPKIAIAYSGTYVVGRSAQFYYEEGHAPTREDLEAFYQQAAGWLRRFRKQRSQEDQTARSDEENFSARMVSEPLPSATVH